MAHQTSGQALVEYVVLLALGSAVAIGTMTLAGPQLSAAFGQLTAAVAHPMELLAPAPTPTPQAVAPSGPITDPAPAAAATAPAPTPTPAAAPTPSPVVHPTPAPTPAEHDEGKHKGQQGG